MLYLKKGVYLKTSLQTIDYFFQEFDFTSEIDKRAIYLLITFGCLLIFRSIIMFYNKHKLRKVLFRVGCNVTIEIEKGSVSTYYKKHSMIRLIFIFMNRSYVFPYGSSS